MTKPARRRWWIDIVGDARDPMPCDAYDSPKFEDLIPVSELLPGDVILTREEAEKILKYIERKFQLEKYAFPFIDEELRGTKEILEAAMSRES